MYLCLKKPKLTKKNYVCPISNVEFNSDKRVFRNVLTNNRKFYRITTKEIKNYSLRVRKTKHEKCLLSFEWHKIYILQCKFNETVSIKADTIVCSLQKITAAITQKNYIRIICTTFCTPLLIKIQSKKKYHDY